MADTLQDAARRELARRELLRRGIEPPEDPYLPGAVDLSRAYRPKIDPRRAVVLGASQGGTLGYADEIGGLTAAATAPDRPGRVLGKAFELSPDDTPDVRRIKLEALASQPRRSVPWQVQLLNPDLAIPDAPDVEDFRLAHGLSPAQDPLSYKAVRDSMRAEAAKAAKEQPGAYLTGEAIGGLGSGVVAGAIPVLGETKAAGSALKMLIGGPYMGGIQGLGSSNAPLGSPQSARDILLGAGLGAGGEAIGAVAGKVAPKILQKSGEVLEKRGVDNARKVLTSGSGQLNRHMTSDAAPRIALEEKAIPLFGTTETAYKRLVPLAEEQGKRYADIIARLEQAGIPPPRAREIATEMIARAEKDWLESGADKSVSRRFRREAENAQNVANQDTGRLGLQQAEAIKRRLQAEARGEYMKAGPDSPMGHAKKTTASIYRQAVEDAVEGGRTIPDEEWLYHVTPEANMSAIRKEGLRPDAPKIAEGGPHGDTQAVFLGEQSLVPTYENLYGGEGLAVVRTPRHGLGGLTRDTASEGAAWMTPNAILPERLQVRTASGGWEDVVPGSTAKRIQDIDAFVPVKRRLGPLIEARDTAELGMQKFQSRTSGAAPSGIDYAAALATQNPLPLLGGPLRALTKERLPSLVARSEFGAGRGLQSLAGRMSASGNTLPFTGGLGSVAARTLGITPEAPQQPGIPEGSEADFERWRLEQELQGKALPDGQRLKRLLAKGKR